MTEQSSQHNPAQNLPDLSVQDSQNKPVQDFIYGDLFSGISVSALENKIWSFELAGHSGQVIQAYQPLTDRLSALSFHFALAAPVRFRLDVMIPEFCVNACALLNRQVLIMPFSADWPEEECPLRLTDCQKKEATVSTLYPGRFQSINFRWEQNDHLIFFLVTAAIPQA